MYVMKSLLLPGAFAAALAFIVPAAASASEPITLTVDSRQAPSQDIELVHERLPVQPGALRLLYPEYLPGEHGPTGIIENVAGLVIKGGGKTLDWNRDPHDMYAFNVTVPQGVDHLDIDMTYLGASNDGAARLATQNMAVIRWERALLYPSTGTLQSTVFVPSLILPGASWHYATALTGAKMSGDTVTFDPTTLEHVVDSPLDEGVNYKRWQLWSDAGQGAYLNIFGDFPENVDVSDETVAHYKKLVREMLAMYGARHWRNYNFLLTLSDQIPGEGLEHHESSDDGEGADFLTDDTAHDRGGDLLSHEFNHSWNGKYRMPAGLYQPTFNDPLDDSLLWVYEGMTQYYGNVMSWRDGIRDQKTWPDHIAATYAFYDYEPGRDWRPILDTAVGAYFGYDAPGQYSSYRRRVDYYSEGELMWLKVDSILRERTNDRASLDTFAHAFYGGANTGPDVKTYTRADIIAGLQAIAPYDWAGFFHTWIDNVAQHPPDGFTAEGYRLVYNDKPQHFIKRDNYWYSIGANVRVSGEVGDVRFGSAAWKAGLGINTKIVAVNGRAFSTEAMIAALNAAKGNANPIRLTVERNDLYRDLSVDYHDGPRYPHLERIPNTPDRLMEVSKPKTGA